MDPRAASSAGQPAPARRFYPTHPLFPLPCGERETKEIHSITFDRWDHQGKKERCPLRLPASEIRSFGDIVDMFGGGTYAFVAYDSKGRVARRTAHVDRVHLNIPCRPLDPTAPKADARRKERAAEPVAPTLAPVALQPPSIAAMPEEAAKATLPFALSTDPQLALMQSMIHQTNAAEERALKFGLMVDRLRARHAIQQSAQPAAAQASSAATMDAFAALVTAMPQPSSPAMDPMFVLKALTILAEAARPADPLTELERLVPVFLKVRDIMNQGRSSKETTRRHPDITEHNHGGARMSNQSPKASTDPALVWVEIPDVGWVQMAPETAAAYFARQQAQSAPTATQATTTPTEPSASPAFWDAVVTRMRDPNELAACKRAVERKIATQEKPASNPPLAPHERGFWDDIADRLAIPSERAAFQEAGARAARAQTSTAPTHERDHQEQRRAAATSPAQLATTQPQRTRAPIETQQAPSAAAQAALPLPRERDGSLDFTEFTIEQMEIVLADAEEVEKLPPGVADVMRTMIAEDRAARAMRAQSSATNPPHVAAASPTPAFMEHAPSTIAAASPTRSALAANAPRSAPGDTRPEAPTEQRALPLPVEMQRPRLYTEISIKQPDAVLADAGELAKMQRHGPDSRRDHEGPNRIDDAVLTMSHAKAPEIADGARIHGFHAGAPRSEPIPVITFARRHAPRARSRSSLRCRYAAYSVARRRRSGRAAPYQSPP